MIKLAIIFISLLILGLTVGVIGCGGDGEPDPYWNPPPDRSRAYETDQEVIQLASSTFYADVQAGWDSDAAGGAAWGCSNATAVDDPGHYYPTELAVVGSHILTLSDSVYDPANIDNFRIEGVAGAATDSEMARHAIWMGLLVNAPGEYESAAGTIDRRYVSPLTGRIGLYLQNFPDSAMTGNEGNGAPAPGGSYCWVVGKNGSVYGAYRDQTGYWYHGFNGVYP